uniref:Uncharacterized protein n=1 Tax=viral metagenome TaxID=1070528 RepID=A0A6C0HEA3_9ZZZZ
MGYNELEKHLHYKKQYREYDLYWGIGIEEETYMQFSKPVQVAVPILQGSHNHERYSVKYFSNYKPFYKDALISLFPDTSGCIPLPLFLNAHAFNKMDISGNHKTTYEKVPKVNPRFTGKTFFESLKEYKPRIPICNILTLCNIPKSFISIFESSCTFDGDSIEFITQDFYKNRVCYVLQELISTKYELLECINNFLREKNVHKEKGFLMYPQINPGFTIMYTNPSNVAMFNNGTYHINITLPSLLGKNDKNGVPVLLHPTIFMKEHRRFIRYIQWLEPFIIAVYGTKDPLSVVSDMYTKSSQRCAISRYIGIGTYDTNLMLTGKILTNPVCEIRGSKNDFWWYNVYHKTSGYLPLEELGMDINYKKHYNHGVEIRFLDWFPETKLQELISFFINLADASLEIESEPDEAIMNKVWNGFVVSMLQNGPEYKISDEIISIYSKLLCIPLHSDSIHNVFICIQNQLKKKYKNSLCARYML